jgi:hypothetical protein
MFTSISSQFHKARHMIGRDKAVVVALPPVTSSRNVSKHQIAGLDFSDVVVPADLQSRTDGLLDMVNTQICSVSSGLPLISMVR